MVMGNADFPEKLGFLFQPARYKIARGGRGSTKSWSFARALLLLGLNTKLRILCGREIQKSIKDSVHKLLSDQIQLLRIGDKYEVLETGIRGSNGTEFMFTGLSTHTVESIKSFEGCDICWVEEGQTVSKRSWDILIPTIRKDGSEIWVSFNPDLDTDDTYQRFVTHPPPDCISIEINWSDNPWWNDVLEQERLHCKETDPDNYDNIWEGKCRPAVEGAIYYKEIMAAESNNQICNIPYDPLLKVHVVFDLGWSDSLAAGLVQRNRSEIRLIEYVEASHTRLDKFSAELKKREYNWGQVWLPHDGFSGQLNANGKSTEDILKKLGWKVVPRDEIVELSIEEGIRQVRLKFGQLFFDKNKCHSDKPGPGIVDGFNPTDLNWRIVEALKRYQRRINKQTGADGTPVKNEFTHGADMIRYLCVNADSMDNEEAKPKSFNYPSYAPLDAVIGI